MTESTPEKLGQQGGLRKAIRLRHAVALYATSVLGSGILVLPGLTAKIAGPASLIAWVLLSAASYPFAYTFASLSARRPESGGIYAFAKECFGFRVGAVVGWLFAFCVITGAPAVTLIAASYIGYAFPLSRAETYLIAFGIVASAFAINYRGIVISTRIQLAIVVSIVALLAATIASSASFVKPQNFEPFFTAGPLAVGTAAALIFWSYIGYENTSNVAEEFENPKKDFHRSIVLSVLLVSFLQIAVALVTIGTKAYEAGGSVAPFAAILSNVMGRYAGEGTALVAVFIIFGTVNAYTTGVSRLLYAVARDGGLPRGLAHINPKTGVPDRILVALVCTFVVVLAVYYFSQMDLAAAILVPSGSFILLYVVGSAAGVKLLGRPKRTRMSFYLPLASLVISLMVLPFIGLLLVPSLIVVALAAAYIYLTKRTV